jgi:hypothetical protein
MRVLTYIEIPLYYVYCIFDTQISWKQSYFMLYLRYVYLHQGFPPPSRNDFRIYRCQEGDRGKFCTEGPQILGAVVQNLNGRATWRPGFVHPCFILTLKYYWLVFIISIHDIRSNNNSLTTYVLLIAMNIWKLKNTNCISVGATQKVLKLPLAVRASRMLDKKGKFVRGRLARAASYKWTSRTARR